MMTLQQPASESKQCTSSKHERNFSQLCSLILSKMRRILLVSTKSFNVILLVLVRNNQRCSSFTTITGGIRSLYYHKNCFAGHQRYHAVTEGRSSNNNDNFPGNVDHDNPSDSRVSNNYDTFVRFRRNVERRSQVNNKNKNNKTDYGELFVLSSDGNVDDNNNITLNVNDVSIQDNIVQHRIKTIVSAVKEPNSIGIQNDQVHSLPIASSKSHLIRTTGSHGTPYPSSSKNDINPLFGVISNKDHNKSEITSQSTKATTTKTITEELNTEIDLDDRPTKVDEVIKMMKSSVASNGINTTIKYNDQHGKELVVDDTKSSLSTLLSPPSANYTLSDVMINNTHNEDHNNNNNILSKNKTTYHWIGRTGTKTYVSTSTKGILSDLFKADSTKDSARIIIENSSPTTSAGVCSNNDTSRKENIILSAYNNNSNNSNNNTTTTVNYIESTSMNHNKKNIIKDKNKTKIEQNNIFFVQKLKESQDKLPPKLSSADVDNAASVGSSIHDYTKDKEKIMEHNLLNGTREINSTVSSTCNDSACVGSSIRDYIRIAKEAVANSAGNVKRNKETITFMTNNGVVASGDTSNNIEDVGDNLKKRSFSERQTKHDTMISDNLIEVVPINGYDDRLDRIAAKYAFKNKGDVQTRWGTPTEEKTLDDETELSIDNESIVIESEQDFNINQHNSVDKPMEQHSIRKASSKRNYDVNTGKPTGVGLNDYDDRINRIASKYKLNQGNQLDGLALSKMEGYIIDDRNFVSKHGKIAGVASYRSATEQKNSHQKPGRYHSIAKEQKDYIDETVGFLPNNSVGRRNKKEIELSADENINDNSHSITNKEDDNEAIKKPRPIMTRSSRNGKIITYNENDNKTERMEPTVPTTPTPSSASASPSLRSALNSRHCVIKVLGVGNGGVNAINRMTEARLGGVDLWAINTDAESLAHSVATNKLIIGQKVTLGLGTDGDSEEGTAAVLENIDQLKRICADADMIFITAGLGGGTGSGVAPTVANIAKTCGALTVGVVTTPFASEGPKRQQQADNAIAELRKYCDTLIVASNDKLLQSGQEHTPVTDAFLVADALLNHGVIGISEIIVKTGLVNVDFSDVRAVMKSAGKGVIGVGKGTGDNRAADAALAAISSPSLDFPIQKAKRILFNIVGGEDMGLQEINEAAEVIYEYADENANIVFGALIDPTMMDEISMTVLACDFEAEKDTTTSCGIIGNFVPGSSTLLSQSTTENEMMNSRNSNRIQPVKKVTKKGTSGSSGTIGTYVRGSSLRSSSSFSRPKQSISSYGYYDNGRSKREDSIRPIPEETSNYINTNNSDNNLNSNRIVTENKDDLRSKYEWEARFSNGDAWYN